MKELLTAVRTQLSAQGSHRDLYLLSLLLLAPVGAAYVRHWISAIFAVLVFAALVAFASTFRRIAVPDGLRTLFLITIAYFSCFLLSAFLNGWDEGAVRMIEREIRLLGLVPLALLFIKLEPLRLAAYAGLMIAIPTTCALALYEFLFNAQGRELGVYGPLFTGPAVVCAFAALLSLSDPDAPRRPVSEIFVFITALGVAFLTSRSAQIGMFTILVFLSLTSFRTEKRLLISGTTIFLSLLLMNELLHVTQAPSFSLGLREFKDYVSFEASGAEGPNPIAGTSIGARLEMMKASYMIFQESPVWGVGPRNYMDHVSALVSEGVISPLMPNYHPHNFILDVIVTKGLLGLACLGWLLFKIMRLVGTGATRKVFIVTSLAVMLTESAIFSKNNFISLFCLYVAVLIALNLKKEATTAQ